MAKERVNEIEKEGDRAGERGRHRHKIWNRFDKAWILRENRHSKEAQSLSNIMHRLQLLQRICIPCKQYTVKAWLRWNSVGCMISCNKFKLVFYADFDNKMKSSYFLENKLTLKPKRVAYIKLKLGIWVSISSFSYFTSIATFKCFKFDTSFQAKPAKRHFIN